MAGEVNYKMKYNELKQRFMQSVDTAYRLGFEDGAKQSELNNANQQLQMQQEHSQNLAAAAQGMGGGGSGDPSEAMNTNNNGAPADPNASGPDMSGAPSVQPGAPSGATNGQTQGSELDQYISTLEGMVNKSEFSTDDLKKAIGDLKSFQEKVKFETEMKKSAAAIPEIAKALHKPSFKFSTQANKNMSVNAKQAVGMQHKIVEDIMEKWETQEKKASGDILSQLNIEGLTKGE